MPQTITIEQYEELRESNIGICQECGAERECCEPDADGYDCPDCGAMEVQGVDNLLAAGLVV